MYSIDKVGYGKYLLDPTRQIPKAHLSSVCHYGEGEKACRYIALSIHGFVCVKNCPLKEKLDLIVDMAKQGHAKFKARGDNCEGFGTNEKTTKSIQTNEVAKEDHSP
jgi:hypothetical protein